LRGRWWGSGRASSGSDARCIWRVAGAATGGDGSGDGSVQRRTSKNDRNDAEPMATAARQGNMRFIPVKSADQQARLSWHRVREGYKVEKPRTPTIPNCPGLASAISPSSCFGFYRKSGCPVPSPCRLLAFVLFRFLPEKWVSRAVSRFLPEKWVSRAVFTGKVGVPCRLLCRRGPGKSDRLLGQDVLRQQPQSGNCKHGPDTLKDREWATAGFVVFLNTPLVADALPGVM